MARRSVCPAIGVRLDPYPSQNRLKFGPEAPISNGMELLADVLLEGLLRPFGRLIKDHPNFTAVMALILIVAVNVLIMVIRN